jgi:predicted phage tail component-like protein
MITLDNRPLSNWGLSLLYGDIHPATPDLRQNTLTIPGRAGKWDFGSEWDSRTFELPLILKEPDSFEMQRKLNDFVAFLLDPFGRPRDIKLVFDYEPDKYYTVRLSGNISPERLYRFGKFPLILEATDPYKKFSVPSDEIIMNSDVSVMSDILWNTELVSYNVTFSQTFTILNQGTVAIPLSIDINGSGTNVTFELNGQTFSLGTFIDTFFKVIGESYTILKDNVEDLTSISGDFLTLMPGENHIQVTGSNLDLFITESIIYKYI